MRKTIFFQFLITFFCIKASAQCNTVNPKDIDNTCKSLKLLMDCHLIKKDYTNALSVYLTFKNINEDYQPPLEIKKYFKDVVDKNKASLVGVKLTLTNTEPKRHGDFKSSMPEIIQVSN